MRPCQALWEGQRPRGDHSGACHAELGMLPEANDEQRNPGGSLGTCHWLHVEGTDGVSIVGEEGKWDWLQQWLDL